MSYLVRCVCCDWKGDLNDCDPGIPVDVDQSDLEPGDYAEETMVKCPECDHSVESAED